MIWLAWSLLVLWHVTIWWFRVRPWRRHRSYVVRTSAKLYDAFKAKIDANDLDWTSPSVTFYTIAIGDRANPAW